MNDLNVFILDSDFERVAVIDSYSSFIWSDRFDEAGEFELKVPYDHLPDVIRECIVHDNYVSIDQSDRIMVIEKIEDNTDDNGITEMVVSGRSLESILDRRIYLTKTEFTDANVQDSIYAFLYANIINPAEEKRKINNFVFSESEDERITELTFSDTFDKDDIYEIISSICKDAHIGFKMVLNEQKEIVFSLYVGNEEPTVTFSPYYDNLRNSNYYSSIEDYKNVMYVSKDNEDEGYFTIIRGNEESGLKRREVHVNESELKSNKSGTVPSSYLYTKGERKLENDYKIKTAFDAEIIPGVMFNYIDDYNTGDHVILVNTHGNSKEVYISEVAITRDENGLTILPTFQEIEEKEDE